MTINAYRADLLDYTGDPAIDAAAVRYVADGLLVVENDRVVAHGEYDAVRAAHPDANVIDHSGKLILPGLIDAHVHYPQTTMIASYGAQLLSWLEQYAFPTELGFADRAHADMIAKFFLEELLRNGTTSAVVLCTAHAQSVDVLAEHAVRLGMRLVLGKVCSDRNVPEGLCDTAQSAYDDSKVLIERWHGRERLSYALTPRFAPACTDAELEAVAQLHREHPTTYVYMHLVENKQELAWVAELYPGARSYTDAYARFGLLTDRSIFAHGIHLDDADLSSLADARSAIAFCPTSNLFLGSGLFPFERVKRAGVRIGIATDVGAGTSFSVLRTLSEAYKVMQLQGDSLSAHQALHLATLGSAESLSLGAHIGNFEPGKEADFIVLDDAATPLTALRSRYARTLEERLFALIMLADDRAVAATYVRGECVHTRVLCRAEIG
jgi:guanine deaminase